MPIIHLIRFPKNVKIIFVMSLIVTMFYLKFLTNFRADMYQRNFSNLRNEEEGEELNLNYTAEQVLEMDAEAETTIRKGLRESGKKLEVKNDKTYSDMTDERNFKVNLNIYNDVNSKEQANFDQTEEADKTKSDKIVDINIRLKNETGINLEFDQRKKSVDTHNTSGVAATVGLAGKCLKRLPNAIIVGVQKSGTSALLKFLSIHPQIAACLKPEEPQYFTLYYTKPLEWYKNLMPCNYSDQITVEKSPSYFYKENSAERIRRMNERTKIIIIVKDPIIRAQSMYEMLKERMGVADISFEDMVTLSKRTKVDGTSLFIYYSNYAWFMKAWIKYFPLNQILVVDVHNLESNPAEELAKVEFFLRIRTFFSEDKFAFNSTKGKYCIRIDDENIECLNERKGRPHVDLHTEARRALEDYFRQLNEQFFQLIHKR